MSVLHLIIESLLAAAGMFWSMLWALILGFALSAIVIVFIPKEKMVKLLGRPGPKEILTAAFFGSVSSSCSYAAAAMAKSLFQKGAHIITALAFMMASTNLVIELSAVLWILMGWQFVLAEFMGGILLVFIMSGLMSFIPSQIFEKYRVTEEPENCHGENEKPTKKDFTKKTAWILVGQSFISEWTMLWKDILLGVLISGFLMVFVPDSFWRSLFLKTGGGDESGWLRLVENALVGPLVSVISFVCSVGNIPMASALYKGGISFGGALSFIYADLIIFPLILIYKKYYGPRGAAWITGIFYVSMVTTGIIVDLFFQFMRWIPAPPRNMAMPMRSPHFFHWNYTTWLNFIFLVFAGLLYFFSKKEEDDPETCCH